MSYCASKRPTLLSMLFIYIFQFGCLFPSCLLISYFKVPGRISFVSKLQIYKWNADQHLNINLRQLSIGEMPRVAKMRTNTVLVRMSQDNINHILAHPLVCHNNIARITSLYVVYKVLHIIL